MPARVATAWLPLIAVGVVLFAGCRPIGFAPRLVGVWVGTPETAEQWAARVDEAVESSIADPVDPVGEADPGSGPVAAVGPDGADDPVRSTLESFDVRVTLNLMADGSARMWMGEAEGDALRGTWQVVAYERDRAVIEIVAKRGGGPDAGGEEKRRFALQLLEEDRAFTLAEEGADRFFGRLYFRRQE